MWVTLDAVMKPLFIPKQTWYSTTRCVHDSPWLGLCNWPKVGTYCEYGSCDVVFPLSWLLCLWDSHSWTKGQPNTSLSDETNQQCVYVYMHICMFCVYKEVLLVVHGQQDCHIMCSSVVHNLRVHAYVCTYVHMCWTAAPGSRVTWWCVTLQSHGQVG